MRHVLVCRRPQRQVLRARRQLRSAGRLLVLRWCILEAMRMRLRLQLVRRLVMLVGRLWLSLVLLIWRRMRLTCGIVVSTRVVRLCRLRAVVQTRWWRMLSVWVLARQHREVRRARLARRLVGVRCVVVRARLMRARRLGWLRARR